MVKCRPTYQFCKNCYSSSYSYSSRFPILTKISLIWLLWSLLYWFTIKKYFIHIFFPSLFELYTQIWRTIQAVCKLNLTAKQRFQNPIFFSFFFALYTQIWLTIQAVCKLKLMFQIIKFFITQINFPLYRTYMMLMEPDTFIFQLIDYCKVFALLFFNAIICV